MTTISIILILGAFIVTQAYGTSSNRGIDWMKICEKAPGFLLSAPCDELVSDDNELTSKGKRELACLAAPLAGYLIGDLSGLTGGIIGKYLCN